MRANGNSAARITDGAINKSRNEQQKSVLLADVVRTVQEATARFIEDSHQLVAKGRRLCKAADVWRKPPNNRSSPHAR
jgi:hypothetical protein